MPEPSKSKSLWIGFDLGGTKMMSLALDQNLKTLARERKKTKSQDETAVNIERIFKTIRDTLNQLPQPVQPTAIGIGVPGTLDLKKGIILEAPNLGWKNIAIKDLLENEFKCPVVISNDVDAGVFGEYTQGSAQNGRCVLGVFPGTGIGGGLIYNGEIFTGNSNSCLEIGHMQVVSDGLPCGCGRIGCLETVASRLAIATAAAAAIFRGNAPNLQKLVGYDISKIKSNAIAQSIKSGDLQIKMIVAQAAKYLGKAIGNVINLLTPDLIVLGGGLVEAMPELYLNEVEKAIHGVVMPSFSPLFKLVTAKLGDDATAIGAAAWARKLLIKEKNGL